jgi:hypothetical protein
MTTFGYSTAPTVNTMQQCRELVCLQSALLVVLPYADCCEIWGSSSSSDVSISSSSSSTSSSSKPLVWAPALAKDVLCRGACSGTLMCICNVSAVILEVYGDAVCTTEVYIHSCVVLLQAA